MSFGVGRWRIACEGRSDVAAGGYGQLFQYEFDQVAVQATSSATVLYCALVTMRNSQTQETCPLGIALLQRKTALTRRTIFRHLAELEAHGFVTRRKSGKKLIFGFPLITNGDTSDTQMVTPVTPRTEREHKACALARTP